MKKICLIFTVSITVFALLLVMACGDSNPGGSGTPDDGKEDTTGTGTPPSANPLRNTSWLYKDSPDTIRFRTDTIYATTGYFTGGSPGTYTLKGDTLYVIHRKDGGRLSGNCHDSSIVDTRYRYRVDNDTLFLGGVTVFWHEYVNGRCEGQEPEWIYAEELEWYDEQIDTLYRRTALNM